MSDSARTASGARGGLRDDGTPPSLPLSINPRNAALTIVATILSIYFLQWARELLIPVVVAVLIAFALTPVADLLQRAWLPRLAASAVAITLFAGALGLGAWTISDDAVRVVEDLPQAAREMRDRLRTSRRGADGALAKVERAATEIEKTAAAAAPADRAGGDVQRVQIVEPAFRARDYLWWGGMGLIGFGAQLLMVLFLSYFLLASGDLYKRKLVKIAGPTLTQRKITVQILDDVTVHIGRFLLTLAGTSLIVATTTGAVLWWLGLEAWLFWGLVSGVLNTIPYFGPVIVSAALAVVSFLQFGTFSSVAAVSGSALAITALEGWLLTPALMGRAAAMNPVAVFVGLLFWGWVWGVWGVVLAVPMMMLIKAVCDRVDDFNAIGELLGE